MQLETVQYSKSEGWSVKELPDLDSEKTLIILFAAPEFLTDQTPINELTKKYPKSKIIGCSSAGEIYNSYINDDSISVAIVKFEKTPFKCIKTIIPDYKQSFNAGQDIFDELNKDDLSGILILSNGVNINGTELVNGLNKNNKKKIPITGGLAGDGDRFGKTWAVYNGEITLNTAVAVGFYGNNIKIGHASKGGWDVFGPERRITKSQGSVVYEIDGNPALKLYKEYLGDRANELPSSGLLYPISIRKNQNDANSIVRTILAVDEEQQSLTFAGDVPTGYLAQLMRANFDRLIQSAGEAGMSIVSNNNPDEKIDTELSIAISCVGRRLLLGERTEEEVESLLDTLPENVTKQIGFYSYGEISPFASGDCTLHNQTMTVTILREAI